MRFLLIAGLALTATSAFGQPELDYTAFSVTGPTEAEAGSSVTLTLEVGSRDLSSVAYGIVFRANDDEQVTVATGSLSFTASVETIDVMVTVPSSLSGRQEILLSLDPLNAALESNEFDNVVEADDPIRVRPRQGDLVVESVAGPGGRVELGAELAADVEISNQGTSRVQGSLRLVLSRGPTPSADDPRLALQSIDLAPGASQSASLAGLVPAEVGTGVRRVGALFLPIGDGDRNLLNDAAVDDAPVTVVADTLDWVTASLPRAVLGFSYAALLEAVGGDGEFEYRVSQGSLPPGLRLSMGALLGMPTSSGPFSFTLEVSSDGRVAQRSFDIEVAAVDEELLLVTSGLPEGRLRSIYDQRLVVTGGEPPYTWSSVGGPLPAGIELTADGRLSGTPSEVGTFPLRLRVEESTGESVEEDFFLRIETSASVLVDPNPLPVATAGESYVEEIGVSGGSGPYIWRLGAAPLPPGLTLASSGRLEGRPALTGSFVFQVQVEDSSTPPLTDRSLVFLTVEDAANFEIIAPSPEPLRFRNLFERVYEAQGGVPPYSWSLVPGTVLPNNVVFSNGEAENNQANDGVLRGAPTSVGTFGLGIRVEDAAGRRRELGTVVAVQRTGVTLGDSGGCQSSGGALVWLVLLPALFWRRQRS